MMYTKEELKDVVAKRVIDYLGEGFEDAKIEFYTQNVVNSTVEKIVIKHGVMSPAFNFDAIYEGVKCDGLEPTMRTLSKSIKYAYETVSSDKQDLIDAINDQEGKNIIFTLVNTKQNERLLKDIPHREFNDLSVIYRTIYTRGQEGFGSSIVDNKQAERLGKSESELFELARKNTRRIITPRIYNMYDLLKKYYMEMGVPEEVFDSMFQDTRNSGECLYVVTNDQKTYGSSALLYEDVLYYIAEELNSNLYIIPSSIDEIIVTKADEVISAEELSKMVYEVNGESLDIADRLSNQVYFFDRDTKKVTCVTNVTKGIDDADYKEGLL